MEQSKLPGASKEEIDIRVKAWLFLYIKVDNGPKLIIASLSGLSLLLIKFTSC